MAFFDIIRPPFNKFAMRQGRRRAGGTIGDAITICIEAERLLSQRKVKIQRKVHMGSF